MGRWLRAGVVYLVATIILTIAHVAAAQDSLARARDLYAAAAYEDALALLNGLRASDRRPDEGSAINRYRAFCLLALGRTAEAEHAIEDVVRTAPSYHPSDADVSPRVRTAFRDVRRRMLPAISQQKYFEAKAAFDRHDLTSAAAGFNQVLDLLADSDLASTANQPPLSNLRTLAIGFRDLSVTAAVPLVASPSPRPVPPLSPPPAAPSQPTVPRIYDSEGANVVPPVVLRQSLPALDAVFALRQGFVEVIIDETGVVEAATMLTSVNPVYDRLVLATTKNWRYKPATVEGVPVKFRKIVPIDFKPR